MRLEISRFIECDLDEIAGYIAQDNPRRHVHPGDSHQVPGHPARSAVKWIRCPLASEGMDSACRYDSMRDNALQSPLTIEWK